LAIAHRAPAAAFVLQHTKVGKGAAKILGIYSQRRSELLDSYLSFITWKRYNADFAKNLRASPPYDGLSIVLPILAGFISMDSSTKYLYI
jgi:hypothetical protein